MTLDTDKLLWSRVITLTAVNNNCAVVDENRSTAVGNIKRCKTRQIFWIYMIPTEKTNRTRTVKPPETRMELWVINWLFPVLRHFEQMTTLATQLKRTNFFSFTIPCAICQEKDIMSCGVIESSSSSPLSCSSSFKDLALLNLTLLLLSAFEKATLTWPTSFTPGPQYYRYCRQE